MYQSNTHYSLDQDHLSVQFAKYLIMTNLMASPLLPKEKQQLWAVCNNAKDKQTLLQALLESDILQKQLTPQIIILINHLLTDGSCSGSTAVIRIMARLKKLPWYTAALQAIAQWDGSMEQLQACIRLPGAENRDKPKTKR